MTKKQAMKSVMDYLRSYNMGYHSGVDNGCVQLTLVFDAVNAPDYCVESSIWFYEDGLEARTYYSALGAEICRKSGHIDSLLHVLNFINARVFPTCSNGGHLLYKSHMLYTPRIYLTADGRFDITITTIIPYDFLQLAPIETLDYLTIHCPELLDRLTFPIYGVLLGKETEDMAIAYIKSELLDA